MTADGLHRTPAEIARRGALGETVAGGAVEVQHVARLIQGRVGIVGYRAQFDTPLAASDRPDARYAFRGSAAGMSAAYGEVRSGALHAFGEAGRDAGGTVGAVAGAGAALGRRSEVLVLMRHYPRGFVSLHGYPFGERSGAGQNERGVYAGVRVTGPRWTVSGYLDLYRFPWLRFNVPRPTAGREALVFVEYRPRRWVRAYIQGRIETRDSATEVPNGIASSTVGGLEQDTRRTARLHVDLEASRSLRLRFRVESAAAGRVSRGLLAFQDIRYIPARGVRLDARLTLFETDDYDARLYQLESDVAGAFSLPVLYGRGARAYLAVTLGPYGGFTLQGKLASTFLEDTTGIGTGPDRIDGHRVADAGVQLRWGI